MTGKKYHTVKFLPEGKVIQVEDRMSIFETILEHNPKNIKLKFACGAEGICQKCKIRAFQQMGPMTPTEKGCLSDQEINRGVRLACQARVIQDTTAEIIYKMPFTIELIDEILTEDIPLNPRVNKTFYPDIKFSNISEKIKEDVRQRLPSFIGKDISSFTAVFIEHELLCLEEGDTRDKSYVVAVDLGTNTVVASLIKISSGEKIATVTDTNPQIVMGADLSSRVDMIAEDGMNLEILNEEITLRLDILITELCRACDVDPLNVYEIAIAGSTGMLHFLVSGVPGLMDKKKSNGIPFFDACQLEIRSSNKARVYLLPVISSYAGSDILSGILSTGIYKSTETVLLIDVGSDVKLILCHQGRIIVTVVSDTCIFECAGIIFGMRPETGAIERVREEKDGALNFSVVGDSLPRGICGSGFMELAAFLKNKGVLDSSGNICSVNNGNLELLNRVVEVEGIKVFLLYSDEADFNTDVFIAEKDFNKLFSAAAKVSDVVSSLEKSAGVSIDRISKILIGGAFGRNIDTDVFKKIGLLPFSFNGKVNFVGNSSKKGAQMALIDKKFLPEAEALVAKIELLSP